MGVFKPIRAGSQKNSIFETAAGRLRWGPTDPWYKTTEHLYWRRLILRRDPMCVECRNSVSKVADHIIPISEGGERLALDNGQGMCIACHARKTAEDKKRRG